MIKITIEPELMAYVNTEGFRQVYIRITQNRKHIRKKVETDSKEDMKVKTIHWEGKPGFWINKKHPTYKSYNDIIAIELSKYRREHKKLSEDNIIISKTDVF